MSNNTINLLFQRDVVGQVHLKFLNVPDLEWGLSTGFLDLISHLGQLKASHPFNIIEDPGLGEIQSIIITPLNINRLLRKIAIVMAISDMSVTTGVLGEYIQIIITDGIADGIELDRSLIEAKILALKYSQISITPGYFMTAVTKSKTKNFRCPHCRIYLEKEKSLISVPTSNGKEVKVCKSCTVTRNCDMCGFAEPKNMIRHLTKISEVNGQNQKAIVCSKCTKGLLPCGNCGGFYNGHDYDGDCPCQLRNDFKAHIKEHNADVLNFCGLDSYSDELFGIEIETGTLNKNRGFFKRIASETLALVGRDGILKYDSSIDWINKAEQIDNDYKGFEVVTRPMVYKNAIRFLRNFCKNHNPLLRSWEVGTCGLHIHVSKACLSPFEIGKILLFVNDKANRKFIKMIAKREDKRFAKFLTKKIMDFRNSDFAKCHYEAINTAKPHTIEFRIFRGTLNASTVISYLQFVKSLIEFVRVTGQDRLTFKNYTEFLLSTERSSYRELKYRLQKENTKEIDGRGEI